MKVYIMTRTTHYKSTDEVYTWASAHASRAYARRALTSEMVDLVIANQGSETFEIGIGGVYDIINAYHAGNESETHDAILDTGDAKLYGDIFEIEF